VSSAAVTWPRSRTSTSLRAAIIGSVRAAPRMRAAVAPRPSITSSLNARSAAGTAASRMAASARSTRSGSAEQRM
jgi:hypothetical protein